MISEWLVWSVFLLPLASFLVIALIVRPLFNKYAVASGLLLIACLGSAFLISVYVLSILSRGDKIVFDAHDWLVLGSAKISIGLLIDPVTAVMLVVVTGVSLLVQIYSLGYMKGDASFCRYYAYMALFTASMIGVVIAVNIVQLYVFWELVGVSSYLLIGFWHERSSAAAAAKKAFIITRIGDVGFLLAIIYLFVQSDAFAGVGLNSFHIPDIWVAAQPLAIGGAGLLGGVGLLWFTLGIFAGAAGKSGQFPLHTWLPDAMEGPTPVSALIHAATMVAAGVFLVARLYPVFEQSADTLLIIAIVGAVTAFIAATLGLVMNDIKRVMAYSTISQLGYMMAALGLGAFGPALFHLFTHAFFKALLFLCAGSVNHAAGTFNMQYMGGLRKSMPVTYVATVIGALSLVGIIPFAGFWSKDEILTSAHKASGLVAGSMEMIVWILLLAGVFLTALYSARMIHLTFHGQFRGGGAKETSDAESKGVDLGPSVSTHVHLTESPVLMVIPLVILSFLTVTVGYISNPQWVKSIFGIPKHWITEFFIESLPAYLNMHSLAFDPMVAIISSAIAITGLGIGSWIYLSSRYSGTDPAEDPISRLGPLYVLLSKKYFIDHLYEDIIVRKLFYKGIVWTSDAFDKYIIDGMFNGLAFVSKRLGSTLTTFQTGQVQLYGMVSVVGTVVLLAMYLAFGLEVRN